MNSVFSKIIPKKKEGREEEEKKGKKEEKKKEEKIEKKKAEAKTSISHEYAGKLLLKTPIITEKTKEMSVNGKYTFEINLSANKSEVKKEIERRYGVTVEKVNVIRKKIKPHQYRGRRGKSKFQKKAIITLKEGDKIDIFST